MTVRIVVHNDARRSGKLRLGAELVAGSVIRCRLIGVVQMEDDGGLDDKLIAMTIEKVDQFQAEIQDLQDLPQRHRERIWHFFEQGKWAKITGWGDKADGQQILMASIERYNKKQAAA